MSFYLYNKHKSPHLAMLNNFIFGDKTGFRRAGHICCVNFTHFFNSPQSSAYSVSHRFSLAVYFSFDLAEPFLRCLVFDGVHTVDGTAFCTMSASQQATVGRGEVESG